MKALGLVEVQMVGNPHFSTRDIIFAISFKQATAKISFHVNL